MSLPHLLQRVSSKLTTLSPVYDRVSRAHPTLAPYPTLAILLAKLQPTGNRPASERKALVAALIELHRASPHPLWSSVLLHVFAYVLRNVRRKLLGDDGATRDALVVEAFLEALTDLRTDDPDRIFMYVRQATRRRAFTVLREGAAWVAVGFGIEADLEPDPGTLEEPQLQGVWLRNAGLAAASVELLRTKGDRGALWMLVQKLHPGADPAEHARAFRCLQKRRDRLVVQLRNRWREEEASSAA